MDEKGRLPIVGALQTGVTKLEQLFIGEVSGVDDPANQMPGWMVAKAAGQPDLRVGPADTAWLVGDAEKRVRAATGATDGPTPKYASCFLYSSGEGDRFGDFKFLVTDVVDGELALMPAALKAAAARLPDTDLAETDKEAVGTLLETLQKRCLPAASAALATDETSLLGKVRALLGGATPGKDGSEMDRTELETILAEREDALVTKVAEQVAKSLAEAPAPAAVVPAVETAAEDAPLELNEAQIAQVTKAITDGLEAALEPIREVLGHVIDRTAAVEKGSVRRFSLDGQEGGGEDPDAPSKTELTPLQKAIAGAFRAPAAAAAA